MPQTPRTLIQPGKYYHIYNRGVNRRTIFREDNDFIRFLTYLEKYMEPVGCVYAYALMKDHFHLLVSTYPTKGLAPFLLKDKHVLGRTFGHLQNAYAKYFNHKYNAVSGLFEKGFERKEVDTPEYFRTMILYLHRNAVKHGLSQTIYGYPWSSHPDLRSQTTDTFLAREAVWEKFGGFKNFLEAHDDLDIRLAEADYEFGE